MGTRKVVVTGKGYWMKVFEQNRDLTGFNDALVDIGGQCVMDIDLAPEEVDKLKRAKFMSAGKPSPEGNGLTRMKLKRKWTEAYGGGAPEVLKADGTPWNFEEDGPIGNGSTVAAVVYVYDTKAKNIYGARLDKIKVLEHIPYVKDDFEGVGGPTQGTAPAPKRMELEEDEIPF